jgi:hypothetical protein
LTQRNTEPTSGGLFLRTYSIHLIVRGANPVYKIFNPNAKETDGGRRLPPHGNSGACPSPKASKIQSGHIQKPFFLGIALSAPVFLGGMGIRGVQRDDLYSLGRIKRKGEQRSTGSAQPEIRDLLGGFSGSECVASGTDRPHLKTKQSPMFQVLERRFTGRVCTVRDHSRQRKQLEIQAAQKLLSYISRRFMSLKSG